MGCGRSNFVAAEELCLKSQGDWIVIYLPAEAGLHLMLRSYSFFLNTLCTTILESFRSSGKFCGERPASDETLSHHEDHEGHEGFEF